MKMKSIIFSVIFILFILQAAFSADPVLPANNSTAYLKYDNWAYNNEGDIGKASKDVKDKILMNFGNKVTVLKNKKSNNKFFLQIQTPDKNKYWIDNDSITTKFVVIVENSAQTYTQPDEGYPKAKLETGSFGYYIKEQDGWLYVDFGYVPDSTKKDMPYVGPTWIKKGYSDDIKVAREANLLDQAFTAYYGKAKDKKAAIAALEKAVTVNGGEETALSLFIKDLLAQLKAPQ